MTPHHWPLVSGCDGCIEYVKRDQWIAALLHMSADDLVELLMGREHIHNDWQCEAITAEMVRREAKAS